MGDTYRVIEWARGSERRRRDARTQAKNATPALTLPGHSPTSCSYANTASHPTLCATDPSTSARAFHGARRNGHEVGASTSSSVKKLRNGMVSVQAARRTDVGYGTRERRSKARYCSETQRPLHFPGLSTSIIMTSTHSRRVGVASVRSYSMHTNLARVGRTRSVRRSRNSQAQMWQLVCS